MRHMEQYQNEKYNFNYISGVEIVDRQRHVMR